MSLPLSEKYRPKEFEEVVGIADLEEISKLVDKPLELPNLLFWGPQGVGKSTVAKILINKLQPIDVIRLNGSDTTGVDVIRDKVYNFMTSMSSRTDKPKIIWIEEFDFMSASAFAALRSMIEQFIKNARFICTCNYINKIPEPIQSRFTVIEFHKPKDLEIFKRVKIICNIENITVEDKILSEIVTQGKGDIRTIINNIQQLSANEDRTITKASGLDDFSEVIYKMILKKEWSKIRYLVAENNPDYIELLVKLDDLFFNSDLPVTTKAAINDVIAKGLYELNFSFNHAILFSAVCSRIIQVI